MLIERLGRDVAAGVVGVGPRGTAGPAARVGRVVGSQELAEDAVRLRFRGEAGTGEELLRGEQHKVSEFRASWGL